MDAVAAGKPGSGRADDSIGSVLTDPVLRPLGPAPTDHGVRVFRRFAAYRRVANSAVTFGGSDAMVPSQALFFCCRAERVVCTSLTVAPDQRTCSPYRIGQARLVWIRGGSAGRPIISSPLDHGLRVPGFVFGAGPPTGQDEAWVGAWLE